ncbi:hypothetical protein RDV78_01165 [Bacillota bacterium LX-D]|nr:hypothetical protein [Bacillota bacterium LX-D]
MASFLEMLAAILIVALFYTVFFGTTAEMAPLFPYAGGLYAYAYRGLGSFPGYLTGMATILEFICLAAFFFDIN